MICESANNKKYPAVAAVHAQDMGTAKIFAKLYAEQNGAKSVEFPICWETLPRKLQNWFSQRGVYSF
jgi:hypothetical protein